MPDSLLNAYPVLILILLLAVLLLLCMFALIRGIGFKTGKKIYIDSNIVNDMRKKLEKAGQTELSLSIGKELQKKFLPLEMDSEGNTSNYGCNDSKNAVFFGYYEGAAGLSGDYFDYKDLDGRYYAIIKCDVAGKGIPAALLMIQVATMFLNYFKDWKISVSGMNIEKVVYQINGFIDDLGFKGRFAAFTLCLFDSQTGDLHFCNAGDNLVHICDTSEKCIKSITLPASPAAGAIPNSVVKARGGYQVQTLTLDHGDILLLFTDGIEEAQRAYPEITALQSESFGSQRVYDIINAVLNRQTYTLSQWQNSKETPLYFDYSDCEGSVEDVIIALISAEKIFRCYRQSGLTGNDSVLVDKKIDAFLKKYFLQYDHYCSRTADCPENNGYMYYTHLKETQQYDDLAILGIKRK